MSVPQAGDEIYIDSELHLSHGADDLRGGRATVTKVEMGRSRGVDVPFVEVAENPGSLYNWEVLAEKQSALAAQFGDRRAHADPDLRPAFNDGVAQRAGSAPETSRERSAVGRTGGAVPLLVVVAIAVYLLDWWAKATVLDRFAPNASVLIIPRLLWFTYVQNTHGAFGLFGSSPIVLIVLALIVLGVFAFAFRDAVQHSTLVRVAFGMILGGAIGNIADRVQHHYVVDFIDFKTIWPNVFNVADACITIGVGLLIIASLRRESRS